MKILAISHEASATGAPIFFCTLLNQFKEKIHGCEIDLIIIKDGVTRGHFTDLGSCLHLSDFHEEKHAEKVLSFIRSKSYDFVYSNTIESAHVLKIVVESNLLSASCRIVSHVHELEGTIQKYGASRISVINQRADVIITVSDAVKNNLVSNHGFDPKKISVINPCSRVLAEQEFLPEDLEFFKRMKHHRFILGCGEMSVGKGLDIFIQTAISLKKKYVEQARVFDFHFLWLGPDSYRIKAYFERDLDILNLRDEVSLFTHRDVVTPFFNIAEIFFMSSRQDSFPLVCLEAASMKKPIIYFPEAGGIKDFLGQDCGVPLSYLDFSEAANIISHLLSHPDEASVLGERAYSKWSENFSPENVFQKVLNIITNHI